MVFSLTKLAYHACSDREKRWYNTVPNNVIQVKLEQCCYILLKSIAENTDFTENFNGFPYYTVKMCFMAAIKGHLDCLQLAHSLKLAGRRGFEWDESTTDGAARNAHLDCFTFAHTHGCTTNSEVKDGGSHGHLNCLEFAEQHGESVEIEALDEKAGNSHLKCLAYWFHNGRQKFVFDYLIAAKLLYT